MILTHLHILMTAKKSKKSKKDKEFNFAFKNDHLDQEFGLFIRKELAEKEKNQLDVKIELIKDFEASIYFCQLILAVKGKFEYKLSIKGNNIQELISYKFYFYYY